MFLNKIIYLYKFISPLNLQSQLHQQSVSLSFLQIQSRHFPVLRENQNRYSLWFRWMCGWVVCLQICFSQTLQGFQSTKAHLAMLVNCEANLLKNSYFWIVRKNIVDTCDNQKLHQKWIATQNKHYVWWNKCKGDFAKIRV